ncbi:MAG TPA: thermonuclease family protein [Beijerinckiaceae bacterium]|jgi:endonuclease YncB( thermonuclease family)|nr:thermonuclease family protein [Beijerinckiaceae bacterium]
MRPRDRLLALVFSTAVITHSAAAQSVDRDSGIYAPRTPLQSPPLRVEVIDGTRFRDIETGDAYRLYGIETCAPAQTARLGRQPWPCGTMATAWLVTATLNAWLACRTLREESGEHLVRCATAGHQDLAADMLRAGVAVAVPGTDREPAIRAYIQAEQDARKAYRGLWSSTFQMPWEWRASRAVMPSVAHGEATP